jgi:hypothetical protein
VTQSASAALYHAAVPARFWIGEILISEAVEMKLRTRRGITGDMIREACLLDSYLHAVWDEHPRHGWRLVVVGRSGDITIKMMLQEVDEADGVWPLRTAWRTL